MGQDWGTRKSAGAIIAVKSVGRRGKYRESVACKESEEKVCNRYIRVINIKSGTSRLGRRPGNRRGRPGRRAGGREGFLL